MTAADVRLVIGLLDPAGDRGHCAGSGRSVASPGRADGIACELPLCSWRSSRRRCVGCSRPRSRCVPVIAVVFSVATWTSARRLRAHRRAARAVVLACGFGAAVAIGVVLGVPMLAPQPAHARRRRRNRDRRLHDRLDADRPPPGRLALNRRRDEVEAWLSIGATPRQAVRELARDSPRSTRWCPRSTKPGLWGW